MQQDLALQNIQARLRMVFTYLLAQLTPSRGFLLVLGSSNVGEALTGYYTKYDCSAADVNPIGGISKEDLKRFLCWAAKEHGWTALQDVVEAPPTAELRPARAEQSDEGDMGMSYADLSLLGILRKVKRRGPYSMAREFIGATTGTEAEHRLDIVRRFTQRYARNRHKMTTLTPSLHAEQYGCDDNRFDLRPFLYPPFERQFDF